MTTKLLSLAVLMLAAAARCENPADTPPQPEAHEKRQMEGWTVHIDKRLLEGENAELGKHAIRILESQFFTIKLIVEDEKVKRLQQVPVWLDLTCGALKAMQYHPSVQWLRAQGYSAELAKCVHIPHAKGFVDARKLRSQPWVMLHELAHSYHDQVLDFENAEILAAWKLFKESGKYESVLHMGGKKTKHYGLTNQKEFFAEMSEAYFGMNDFYPFNSAELKRDEPELFALLEKIWGQPKK